MSNKLHDLIGTVRDLIAIPDIAANAASNIVGVWKAPYKCKVTAVNWIPSDAITGANTNTFHINVLDTAAAEIATKEFISGTNATAGEVVAIYAPASPLAVAVNGVLRIQRELVGSGLATPYAAAEVVYQGD